MRSSGPRPREPFESTKSNFRNVFPFAVHASDIGRDKLKTSYGKRLVFLGYRITNSTVVNKVRDFYDHAKRWFSSARIHFRRLNKVENLVLRIVNGEEVDVSTLKKCDLKRVDADVAKILNQVSSLQERLGSVRTVVGDEAERLQQVRQQRTAQSTDYAKRANRTIIELDVQFVKNNKKLVRDLMFNRLLYSGIPKSKDHALSDDDNNVALGEFVSKRYAKASNQLISDRAHLGAKLSEYIASLSTTHTPPQIEQDAKVLEMKHAILAMKVDQDQVFQEALQDMLHVVKLNAAEYDAELKTRSAMAQEGRSVLSRKPMFYGHAAAFIEAEGFIEQLQGNKEARDEFRGQHLGALGLPSARYQNLFTGQDGFTHNSVVNRLHAFAVEDQQAQQEAEITRQAVTKKGRKAGESLESSLASEAHTEVDSSESWASSLSDRSVTSTRSDLSSPFTTTNSEIFLTAADDYAAPPPVLHSDDADKRTHSGQESETVTGMATDVDDGVIRRAGKQATRRRQSVPLDTVSKAGKRRRGRKPKPTTAEQKKQI